MTVRRVMGTETEYGIFAAADPAADSADLSAQLLAEYAGWCRDQGVLDVRWDYSGEALHSRVGDEPTRVARLTAQEQRWYRGHSTALPNGARLYIDHGHPEYASPEADTPRVAATYDLAGREVMTRAVARQAAAEGRAAITAYKNNVDGKGAAYGTHENYLVDRAVAEDTLSTALVPFLVTRPVLCGAGRVGIGPASEEPGFQISQRADYIERVVGLETTVNRPIFNTRDEPHADPTRWRRLHVISSDANSLDLPILLKLGSLSLALWVVETHGVPDEWAALALADPVAACREVSRDLTLRQPVELADGRRLTALQIQGQYLATARHMVGADPDPDTAEVLALWGETLHRLEHDPANADGVEWLAKLTLLRSLQARHGLEWADPTMAAVDLQWADVRPNRGLARRYPVARTLIDPASCRAAEVDPPETTRAWLRGTAVRRLGTDLFAAGWQSLVLDTGDSDLVRVTVPDPTRGSRDDVADIMTARADPTDLVDQLSARFHHPEDR